MKEKKNDCLCPTCPSYPLHGKDEAFFCFTGSSKYEVDERGCLCASCPVYYENDFKSLYFCNMELFGDKAVFMRRPRKSEDPWEFKKIIHIKSIARTGENVVESMGSDKKLPFTLDDIHFVPAQIARIPVNSEEKVKTDTVIGKRSVRPLKLTSPIIISGMSYGAVSEKVRNAIASVAKSLGIGFNSGEGGVLEYEKETASDYLIVQYSTGRYGLDDDLIKNSAAVEIRFGQGAYPGKGSYLPSEKINSHVALVRGLQEGEGSYSPAHHPDILNQDDLVRKVSWLRKLTGGAPIGAKIGCGDVEEDVKVLIEAGVDFISIDGFGGGTGAVNPHIRDNTGVPLLAAIPRAVKTIINEGFRDRVSLIAGGGLRTGADMAKCLALGADAIYIGTAALIALNCQQHRLCHTGMCPTGITTHDPNLLKNLDLQKAIERLKNYIKVSTDEIAEFTRIVGKRDVSELNHDDIVAIKKEVADITGIRWITGD